MGNAGSNLPRERHKSSSSDVGPNSPVLLKDGQAFVFDKKNEKGLPYQGSSHEEEEPYYTKPVSKTASVEPIGSVPINVPAAKTALESNSSDKDMNMNEGTVEDPNKKKALPTVFKWDGGGKEVYISGTFSEWKPLPMVKSHGDFVTIIDLPEGEHQFKFCVDGEWRHDPKLVGEQNE